MPKREQPSLFASASLPAMALADEERLACLRLIRSDNVGPVTFRELIGHYGSATRALAALPELSRRGGRGRPHRIPSAAEAEAELEAARRSGGEAIFSLEPGYPAALAAIEAPPPLLYVKGKRELLARPALAIVGSRQASAAGTKLARMFAAELARAGLIIASGLARGIDATAHEASLATGTIAVIAGGLDVVYPPEHQELQRRIGEVGVLLTEQPPGFVPRGKDFPRRNRLISGLALGVLVIEAARRSGTLVTARFAAEQGREVFAVPGNPLDPRAEGTNKLLKSGATLVTEPADVLEALAPLTHPQGGLEERDLRQPLAAISDSAPDLTGDDRRRVLTALAPEPIEIDEIVRATGLGARQVRIILMELDLAGRIERHGAQLVSRIEAPEL